MDPRAPQLALSTLRSAVGLATWAAPARTVPVFGLGPAAATPDSALVARLFAVRDLALGLALRSPDPAVRRLVARAGIAIDAVDAVASALAAARGGRRAGLVGVGAGALLFVGLGVASLQPDGA